MYMCSLSTANVNYMKTYTLGMFCPDLLLEKTTLVYLLCRRVPDYLPVNLTIYL